ncbi:MAG TPA: MFS transporter [Acidimicrobiales bacterium]|nr:MFS transporter [Acidimicrobiales bacterium]
MNPHDAPRPPAPKRSGWGGLPSRITRYVTAERLFGRPPFNRLAHSHGFIAAADAFFGVSLAGSLFFNVSVDAARPRIVLYLLVTMAPFAVVAPLIGPFVDRLPGGQRALIALTCAGRALVCFNLADELRTLLFYPLAFSILVLGKTYSVAKNTLVPRLVGDPEALVASNSRLSRLATYAGTVAAAVGVGLLDLAGAAWTLRVAGALYVVAAASSLRLPRPQHTPRASRAVERSELHAPGLRRAASAMGALRGAVGFVLFLLAMSLKRSGEPTWLFGAVFAAHAAGGFSGTFVAPRLRRTLTEERLLVGALVLVAIVSLFSSVGPGRIAIASVALAVGLSANAGRQAFDSLVQRDAPDVERGRLFARFETRFQLSWVLGALLAVAAQPPVWAGFLIVGAVTGLATLSYLGVRRRRDDSPAIASAPGAAAARLLAVAETLVDRGDLDAAVVVAAAAVDAATRAGLEDEAAPVGDVDVEVSDLLQRLRRRAMDGEPISDAEAALAISRARHIVERSPVPLPLDEGGGAPADQPR